MLLNRDVAKASKLASAAVYLALWLVLGGLAGGMATWPAFLGAGAVTGAQEAGFLLWAKRVEVSTSEEECLTQAWAGPMALVVLLYTLLVYAFTDSLLAIVLLTVLFQGMWFSIWALAPDVPNSVILPTLRNIPVLRRPRRH